MTEVDAVLADLLGVRVDLEGAHAQPRPALRVECGHRPLRRLVRRIVPAEHEPVLLDERVAAQLRAGGQALTVGRRDAVPVRVELEAVEGAFDPIAHDAPRAEVGTHVRTVGVGDEDPVGLRAEEHDVPVEVAAGEDRAAIELVARREDVPAGGDRREGVSRHGDSSGGTVAGRGSGNGRRA